MRVVRPGAHPCGPRLSDAVARTGWLLGWSVGREKDGGRGVIEVFCAWSVGDRSDRCDIH